MNKHSECDVEPYIYSVVLSSDPSSVALARRTLLTALREWRIEDLADSALLVISELVTNAIKFADDVVAYIYLRGPDRNTLTIEVGDDSRRLPEIMNADDDDENHRGLVLVDALATHWGTEPTNTGKIVWADLEHNGGGASPGRIRPPGCRAL